MKFPIRILRFVFKFQFNVSFYMWSFQVKEACVMILKTLDFVVVNHNPFYTLRVLHVEF